MYTTFMPPVAMESYIDLRLPKSFFPTPTTFFLSPVPTCYFNTLTRKYCTTAELNIAKLTTAIALFGMHNLGEKWMQE